MPAPRVIAAIASRSAARPLARSSASPMRMAQVLTLTGSLVWIAGQSWTLSGSVLYAATRASNAGWGKRGEGMPRR